MTKRSYAMRDGKLVEIKQRGEYSVVWNHTIVPRDAEHRAALVANELGNKARLLRAEADAAEQEWMEARAKIPGYCPGCGRLPGYVYANGKCDACQPRLP
jgi:hypothetical protein